MKKKIIIKCCTMLLLGMILAGCQSTSKKAKVVASHDYLPSQHKFYYQSAPKVQNMQVGSDSTSTKTSDNILIRGMSLLGSRYRYGASSLTTNEFDCSSFTQYLFKKEANLNIPRTSLQQSQMVGKKIDRSQIKKGDLLFFTTNNRGTVSHVAIYMGDNQFIHAASKKSGVRIDKMSSSYWSPRFMFAKRILNENVDLLQIATQL